MSNVPQHDPAWQKGLEARIERAVKKREAWRSKDGKTVRVKMPEGSVGNPYVYLPDALGKRPDAR